MFYKISAFIFILIIVISAFLWNDYQNSLTAIAVSDENIQIVVEKGDSFNLVTQKLLDQQLNLNPYWFKFLAYKQHLTNQLKVGEFDLKPGLTAPEVLQVLVAGRVKQYSITFPEGLNFKEILLKIQNSPYLKQTLTGLNEAQIMQEIGSNHKNPEGLFFPDTYYFDKNMTDLSLLKRAYRKMQQVLEREWKNKETDISLKTPYETLILASIVEKETGKASERPVIAGVFTRRLDKGMLLQSDPTIIYGMGEAYKGNIRRRDIRAHTAYNTYVIKGLPPTPIAMPGEQAIHAVLHPERGNSLFFVARGDGSHVFSETLREHNRAVNQYQRKKK